MNDKHRAELDLLLAEYERLTGLDPHVDPVELVRRELARNTIGRRVADLLIEMRRSGG